jgi:hypothetical protein
MIQTLRLGTGSWQISHASSASIEVNPSTSNTLSCHRLTMSDYDVAPCITQSRRYRSHLNNSPIDSS